MNVKDAIRYAKSRRAEWSKDARVPADIAALESLANALEFDFCHDQKGDLMCDLVNGHSGDHRDGTARWY